MRAPANGGQTVTVHRATGAEARDHAPAGQAVIVDAAVAFGAEPNIVESGGHRFSTGLRSDPFFVFGIVLEVPDAELGDGLIGVWARVSLRQNGRLVSVDRGAHPSLTAYFNAEEVKEKYNAGEPADDWDTYREPWSAVLAHTGGYSAEDAENALRTVLPDVLRFDRSRPTAYPNGRKLTDDVTSARLAMVSGGKITDDHIGPHTDLLPAFPYLGHPHPLS